MALSPNHAMLSTVTVLIHFQAVLAAQNFVVPWSSRYYGPDGPWQAITVTLGGNDSSLVIGSQRTNDVDLYPGGEWASLAIQMDACTDYPDSLCGVGGTWTPDRNDLLYEEHISITAAWDDASWGVNVTNAPRNHLGMTIGGKTVYSATLAAATEGNVSYPSGFVGGVPLGYLSLGADDQFQFFSTGNSPSQGVEAWLFAGKLFNDSITPSYSYGLHIGSASFDYAGSPVFGGYNKGRVIAPITSFTDNLQLIDVTIGVESGESPFNTGDNATALLAGGPTKATPDSLDPYLSLPGETCANIAKRLPVTFDPKIKYHTWNVEDPQFTKIVTSPAYLGFTFPPAPGDSSEVLVKVPFALLNLTLDKPIADKPTQYFPCLRYDETDGLKLGRAFLQAAFIGRNFQTKTSWLAQAPGPGPARQGLGDQNTDIPANALTIEGFSGANLFAQSWDGHWSVQHSHDNGSTPGNGTENGGQNQNSTEKAGLPTGAKAGIGIGAVLGALAIIAVPAVLWHRRRHSKEGVDAAASAASAPAAYSSLPTNENGNGANGFSPANGHDKVYFSQNGAQGGWEEQRRVSEVPGDGMQSPVEAPDTSPGMRH